ncbi:MAG: helix-turn-helix transcriptional regulator [Solobacterium sp.]|nr:helix-turn-helix transcriptional regulator [Solobacterium sp.]
MVYKLTFSFGNKEYTVIRDHDQVEDLLSVDGVKKISLEVVSTDDKRKKKWNLHHTRQKELIDQKGITARQLSAFCGVTAKTIYKWLSKDDNTHYQKILDIVARYEGSDQNVRIDSKTNKVLL